MKICLVHEEYPKETNLGGIATYQKILAEYFASNGDNVIVITRGHEDVDYFENNVHIYRIKSLNDSNNIYSVKEYRKKVAKLLLELQNKNEIDIIETPDWGANTIYFEKNRKIPLIVRLHTPLKIWLKYNNNDFGISKKLVLRWENAMLKNADSITSCSSLLKTMVIKEYKLKKEIAVINNPCNNRDFYITKDNSNNNIIYVGSLEERKGVLVLAKALNMIFDKIPQNNVFIIGKDTNRNNKNISTREYMLSFIESKYHDRIKFIGQIDNEKINEYLNMAKLAINPSIFDNFPYVILEEMAAGKHVICSNNIGTIDLFNNKKYIFKTNDIEDLAAKILDFYSEQNEFINYDNINLINEKCNPDYICKLIKEQYSKTITEYNKKNNQNNEIISILKEYISFNYIKSIKKIGNNLANDVFLVSTDKEKYIVKKYNYNYDFSLCNEMYDLYIQNNIKAVKPINKIIIKKHGINYNIFNYIKHENKSIGDNDIIELIRVNRKCNKQANLIDKCNKYYDYLKTIKKYKIKEEKHIIEFYEKISKNNLFYENYLNHGDLSKNNILVSNNEKYIIDFDETIITTKLYDFAVMMTKLKVKNNKFEKDKILNIISRLLKDEHYTKEDYFLAIKMYLCKILLEKFYLYEKNIIDLFDSNQIKDNYKKYIKLLEELKLIEV